MRGKPNTEDPRSRPGERWRPAPGFSLYEVSNLGRIRRTKSISQWPARGILKQWPNTDGYSSVKLFYDEGGHVHVPTHRIVLRAFRGPAPPGMECRHLDGNRMNPQLRNLRWGTREQNARDKQRHGTTPQGNRHPNAKLAAEQVREIRILYGDGQATRRQLAAQFGVNISHIHRIIIGESWAHVQ